MDGDGLYIGATSRFCRPTDGPSLVNLDRRRHVGPWISIQASGLDVSRRFLDYQTVYRIPCKG